MFAPRRLALVPLLLAMTLPLSGCREAGPEFGEVEGVVLVQGKPQPGLAIRFLPDPQQGNDLPINASGTTDAEGQYELRHVYRGREGKGAPVGWHRVLIEDTRLSAVPQGQPLPPQVISSAYGNPATTPLTFEVQPGQQTINLEVR